MAFKGRAPKVEPLREWYCLECGVRVAVSLKQVGRRETGYCFHCGKQTLQETRVGSEVGEVN